MKYSFPDGTPIWVDLSTTDLDGAKEFYGQVIGWKAEERTDDDGKVVYNMFTKDGKVAAGLMQAMDGAPSVWSTYFQTADINAMVDKVKAAGGSVMVEPMQVMDSGHMAVVSDDQGAVFGLWQPAAHKGAEEYNEPGFHGWNELATKDVEKAKTFYTAVFGYEYEDTEMDGFTYTSLIIKDKKDVHDHYVGGCMPITKDMGDIPSSWSVYFTSPDIDASVEAVKNAGGKIIVDKTTIDAGSFIFAQDPQGAMFYLLQPPSK